MGVECDKRGKPLTGWVRTMWYGSENQNPNPNPKPTPTPLKKRLSDIWRKSKEVTRKLDTPVDRTLVLSDELLLKILALVSDFSTECECQRQRNCNSLVCKRWLKLEGRRVRSLRISDWNFILSGRLFHRFPNLNHLDLLSAALFSPRNSGIIFSNRLLSIHLDSNCDSDDNILPFQVIDNGLTSLARAFPYLRRLHLIGATEIGLLSVAQHCSTLQELELQRCSDNLLRSIAACGNLQILKLVGHVDGLYNCVVSDIGLTIMAQGCKRLVKLELSGCEGSFDGIKAIGKCCPMLEELTFSHHRMDHGWLPAISFSQNLKTLRFVCCKRIDPNPGMMDHHYLPSLQRLHLQKCHLGDHKSLGALFSVCRTVTQILLHDCWGFHDAAFAFAVICRRVKLFDIEGCSLLTTQGVECVIIDWWKELESLRVVSCKSIKISPSLATLFTTLKELKWSPHTKPLLPSIGNRGRQFFKRPS